ncbi:hypothetical protein JCM19992_25790 [Thermostilla marina]
MFLSPWFLAAGAVAAAGPIIIHLMHRRRYRVVEWAAMDFLLQATRRNRRIFELRDLLLMLLRTACILLFSLGMARPYFTGSLPAAYGPIHAVVVIDNSTSMGYTVLDRSLLNEAKRRAADYLQTLPAGSHVTVLSTCSSTSVPTAYSTPRDAKQAIDGIAIVDRSGDLLETVMQAVEAAKAVTAPETKQIVVFTDAQLSNLRDSAASAELRSPCPIEIIQIVPPVVENAAVVDLRSQDVVIQRNTPTTFVAEIRYEGPAPRNGIPVAIRVDGVVVGTQSIDLEPGQTRLVEFSDIPVDVPTDGGIGFVAIEVSLPVDNLSTDDTCTRMFPVVDRFPITFVDQYGEREDPTIDRLGDTFRLRRLLLSAGPMSPDPRSAIRHTTIDRLDREALAESRVVVIAGVRSPEDKAALLREFVLQGGRILLAPGTEFDPVVWNELAWNDGRGFLPGPVGLIPIGALPRETAEPIHPFQIDFATCTDDSFFLPGTTRDELEQIYRSAFFFKAYPIDVKTSDIAPTDTTTRITLPESWLAWAESDFTFRSKNDAPADTVAVLARYDNGHPFVLERRLGLGRVVFLTSGVFRDWNTLTVTPAVLYLDRLLRTLLQETFPDRNVHTADSLTIPVPPSLAHAECRLTNPGGTTTALPVGAVDAEHWGITLDGVPSRGEYRLRIDDGDNASGNPSYRNIRFAALGPMEESDLTYADASAFEGSSFVWQNDVRATVAGRANRGGTWWRWLILAALTGLVLEMVVLARRQDKEVAP